MKYFIEIISRYKRIIQAIVLIMLLILVSYISFSVITQRPAPKPAVTRESAETKRKQAVEALKINNTSLSKMLFEDAKRQYQELGDNSSVVDIDAQLFLLKNSHS